MTTASRRTGGFATLWMAATLVVFMALVSLAVDLGRVHLVKTELQCAADAAARYAAYGLSDETTFTKAADAADDNKADGTPVVLQNADVETGNWDSSLTPKFSTTRSPVNAIRVTARRTSGQGNAVPLFFASMTGYGSFDISASTVVQATAGELAGFFALTSFKVKNDLFVGGYNPNVTTTPSHSDCTTDGMIGSNGSITAKNNEVIGSVVLGPDGTHNLDLSEPATMRSEDIPTPTVDPGDSPNVPNPYGQPRDLSVSGTVTLGAGTYYFTSITLANNAVLTFSGAATVYVEGNITFSNNGEIRAYNTLPSNLKIGQIGNYTFGGPGANGVTITADVVAPSADLLVHQNLVFRGRAVFDTISAMNNANFYYDIGLGAPSASGLPSTALMQ